MAHKKTILIAEDEEVTLKVFSTALAEAGFNIIEAVDGKQALKLALEKKPDLILLDIQMPKMDGLEMLDQLRNDKWGEHANVILLTNYSDTDKVARAIKNQAFEYLIKTDYEVEDIVKKIKEKLG